jgi:protein SCO1/2
MEPVKNTARMLALIAALFITLFSGPAFSSDDDNEVPNPQALPGPPPVRSWLDKSVTQIGGPFNLVDQDGRNVTEKDYGKYYKLVFFGYTSCPSECPMGLAKMVRSLQPLGKDADNIRILFISTDPARDKPDVMKKYIARFSSDRIIGLTGTNDNIAQVENEYRIFAEKAQDPRFPSYMVNHSTIIYFIAPDGKLLTVFNPADSTAIMAGKIRRSLGIPG